MKKLVINFIFFSILFSCYSKNEKLIINDDFLKKYLVEYPEATIFKIEYLDFFADQSVHEKEISIKNKAEYILKGDFNNNGKEDIAISGLLSIKIVEGKIEPFLIILEKNNNDYKIVFFQKFIKYFNSKVREIQNLSLIYKENYILINFLFNSGYSAIVLWENNSYKIKMNKY